MNQNESFFHRFRTLILVVLAIAVVWAGYLAYYSTTFHIVKTDPKLSAVSINAHYVRLSFSQEIKKGSVQLALPDGLFTKTDVQGKNITMYLNDGLLADVSYGMTIRHVESTGGSTIENKKLTIITRDIPVSKLSKEQQQAMVKDQDQPTDNLAGLPFSDFDTLLDQGLTTDGLNALRLAIFSFSQVRKETFKTLSLDNSSIKMAPYDPNSSNPTTSVSFKFTANNNTYNAVVTSPDLVNATIVITDPASGAVLYDSSRAISF